MSDDPYGFLGFSEPIDAFASASNNAVTEYGAIDAFSKARAFDALPASTSFDDAMNLAGKNASNFELPGSSALGHVGGGLAALGLANDITDMARHGVNAQNGLSATGNALGLGSWAAGTFGATGGAASTIAAPLMAAGAGGLALGTMSNSFMSDMGWLGDSGKVDANGDPIGRSWSDMGADWGTDMREWAGGEGWGAELAGIAGCAGGSLVGTAGTIATAPLVIADAALDLGSAGIDLVGSGVGAAASFVGSYMPSVSMPSISLF